MSAKGGGDHGWDEATAAQRGATEEEGELLRQVAARAVKRLDLLEYVVLGGAAVLALVAGAVVAGLLSGALGLGFYPVWIVASLLFFLVPAAFSSWKARRSETIRRGDDP